MATFHWLEGGYFLVQTYETVFGAEPGQKGVNYWGYDSDAKKFRIIFFSNNGPFTEHGNRYQGEVAAGRLTFEGPARFQYILDDAGRINVNPDDTISVAWWLRDDYGDWQTWMHDTFRRADGPRRQDDLTPRVTSPMRPQASTSSLRTAGYPVARRHYIDSVDDSRRAQTAASGSQPPRTSRSASEALGRSVSAFVAGTTSPAILEQRTQG